MRRPTRTTTLAMTPLMLLALCGAPALGQGSGKDAPKKDPERPVLSGPRVDAPDETDPRASFAPRPNDRVRSRTAGLVGAIGSLRGPDAPEALRLRDEQVGQLRELMGQAERERRAYLEKHADELEQIRAELGPMADRLIEGMLGARSAGRARGERPGVRPDNRRPGADAGDDPMRPGMDEPGMGRDDEPGRPGAEAQRRRRAQRDGAPGDRDTPMLDPAKMTESQRAAFGDLRRLIGEAPGPDTMADRVWEILDEGQTRWVRARLEEGERAAARRERAAPGAEESGDRPMRGDAPMMDEPMERPTDRALGRRTEGLTPERQARLLRLFAQLPADTQEMLLGRLEGMVEDGGRGAARARPAPPMDGVQIPQPEEKPSR